MNFEYDAIVVGARCAGSPTAMLLAHFFDPEHVGRIMGAAA